MPREIELEGDIEVYIPYVTLINSYGDDVEDYYTIRDEIKDTVLKAVNEVLAKRNDADIITEFTFHETGRFYGGR